MTAYDASFWKICTIGLIPGAFLLIGYDLKEERNPMKKISKSYYSSGRFSCPRGAYVGVSLRKPRKARMPVHGGKSEIISIASDAKSIKFVIDKKKLPLKRWRLLRK
ncbi:MAG: hypothetical protein ACLRMZ_25620 [Blautia marasmi]